MTNLSTRARRSELLRASFPPWETRRRWSEPLLPEAVMTPPEFAEIDGGRSTEVRPPLVFVLLLLLPPLTRMGFVFSS